MVDYCSNAGVNISPSVKEEPARDSTKHDEFAIHVSSHGEEMPRQFSWSSALALGFSITNSWAGYMSNFGQNVTYGGRQVCLFSLLVAFAAQLIITVGLSELASGFPSSGGQYYICFIISPEKHRRFSGFVVGWISVFAWWIVTYVPIECSLTLLAKTLDSCSGISLSSNALTGIVHFWDSDFVPTQWQTYLVYAGVSSATLIPLFVVPKKVSLLVQCTFYISIIGFILFFVVSLGMHRGPQHAEYIVQSGQGSSGWGEGTAWMLGIANAMYPFGGPDAAIHISDEIKDPGRRIPQVMMATLVIGLLTCFPLFVVFMSFMKDIDAVVNAPLPSIELVNQIIGNKNVTTFLFVWLWIVYTAAIPAQWITCGRTTWAFAQDHGLPFSEYFSRIDPGLKFPVRATIAAFLFTCIYGLLYLASSTAFNSIITTAVLFLTTTYVVPQGILLSQGRSRCLPESRYLKLGYVGLFCNVFSVLYIIVLGTFLCFPPLLPVTKGSMSYTSPVLVGLFAVIVGMWFIFGRKKFQGPKIDCDIPRNNEK
ncbi:hypothetical protein ASPWEDRAFT_152042 [Aspergillus wentii DTO 134E9]|uniref:Amino acid permease/ SLC12A domain-containing protein n=1 Tax=Aspergillus wentii DTO 134E9 TaxID=1073089 RepID=A0A1L9RNY3_ASPWE|nr:uncharacterized protein ASPWEDRAFT_152042 [Aspergillus wentii DTO 134E9]OJJ36547.1 hypothetical protein ASPWEDRAFT_152042 [Aspergillus wentii DTO 134E9]